MHNAPTPTPDLREREVRCPACGKPCTYGPSNPSRPFCSMRCRNADFGAWASENYRVAAAPDPTDDSDSSAST